MKYLCIEKEKNNITSCKTRQVNAMWYLLHMKNKPSNERELLDFEINFNCHVIILLNQLIKLRIMDHLGSR